MKNKKFILFLTLILSALSIYYLTFTGISFFIEKKSLASATDENGNIDFDKHQKYLSSIWKKKIINIPGFNFTYEQIKEKELSQGLDLQGGMSVTLEISPVDIIKGLSGNSTDSNFLAALKEAEKLAITQSSSSFVDNFYKSYKKISHKNLNEIFLNAVNKGRIKYNSTDKEILAILKKEINGALDRSLYIIRNRIDQYGTLNANIQKLTASNRIQIELPGVNKPERIRKLLQNVAKLSFWEVYNFHMLEKYFAEADKVILAEQNKKIQSRTVFKSPFTSKYGRFRYSLKNVPKVKNSLMREDIINKFPKDVKFIWGVKPIKFENDEVLEVYPIKKSKFDDKPLLEGDVITDAQQTFEPNSSAPCVSMQMNSKGSQEWKRVTKNNIGKQIAIVLDNKVYSAPRVNSEIPNGASVIQGNFSLEEAKDLANILKAGSLPAPVKIVEEATVGPTLGKEAQIQGILSMLLGLSLVIIFMVLYYSTGGLIAVVALLFNIIFILGTLAQLNASLTLPGIAGIVLTIGMSIDANVLIFERIREELLQKRHIKEAISIGYKKAYSSIIDSNLTTFLTGLILYLMGTGPIKGFATTMMIGIISSFFSAIFITRLIFEYILQFKKNKEISFSFNFSNNILKNLNINFLKIRKFSYMFSVAIICVGGILLVSQKGLNLGVDFVGGRTYIVNMYKPLKATDIKNQLYNHSFDHKGTEVKTYGANTSLKITTSYLINDSSTEADKKVQNALITGLEEFTNMKYKPSVNKVAENEFTIKSTSKVGATIASDIKSSSKQSILLSLIMIFLYILMRFRKWQFGISSIIALVHDSLIVIASFAIARLFGFAYEIDQVFIAAILTVIGYSINDTVVVFDRIRENLSLTKNSDFVSIYNKSINETLSRTLITSFTTFIAVFILFIFGGEVLRGFSFAMLIGVIFGTYSSIFIATPLAVDLSKIKFNKIK